MQFIDIRAALAQAAEALGRGDLPRAEQAARSALTASGNRNADALHLLGLVRINQQQLPEAAGFLAEADRLRPGQPRLLLNYGKVLAALGQPAEAAAMLALAIKGQPGLAEAWYELGNQQHSLRDLDAAEQSLRRALTLEPRHGWALVALARLLTAQGRAADAETLLAQAQDDKSDPSLTLALAEQTLAAQKRQNKLEDALQSATLIGILAPGQERDAARVDLLHALGRFDETLALLRAMLARAPGDLALHQHYNGLLYQLGREDQMFASYDTAPNAVEAAMAKAGLMTQMDRHEAAHQVFADLLAREPGNLQALTGAAASLATLGRHGEAVALMEAALAQNPDDPNLRAATANAALQGGDAQKAAALLESVVALAPHDHQSLARLSTAWRLLDDARDEVLMDYDRLIAMFELEPPQGFSDMESFNAELEAALAALHPPTREFLGQSLRSGTQTLGHLFGSGHVLVDKLKTRIDEGVARYIAALRDDPAHPLDSRRSKTFDYVGSWSSRLADCGFHVNHIHPMGWISSCYYVGVPDVVADTTAKQGWIKFGEPNFATTLAPRHAIQPGAGRMVLFPSYMWHGTNPFHSKAKRTTIAFDVVPL